MSVLFLHGSSARMVALPHVAGRTSRSVARGWWCSREFVFCSGDVDVDAVDSISGVVIVAEAIHAEIIRRDWILFRLAVVEPLSHAVVDQFPGPLIDLPFCHISFVVRVVGQTDLLHVWISVVNRAVVIQIRGRATKPRHAFFGVAILLKIVDSVFFAFHVLVKPASEALVKDLFAEDRIRRTGTVVDCGADSIRAFAGVEIRTHAARFWFLGGSLFL